MRIRVLITAVGVAALFATSVAAASKARHGSQPIYGAFTILSKKGTLTTRRCNGYQVTTATYTGTSTSPDPRLAGSATVVPKIAVFPGSGTGFVTGTLVIRDPRRRIHLRSTLTGVVTNRTVVNGLVRGTLMSPSALLLANVTIVFDTDYRFGAVRLGLESGQNSAVAYSPLKGC
jgi:hypothetical protein